jgi:glucose/arabinose dehydrogenase
LQELGHSDLQPWSCGVAVDRQGALLVADDVGNTVWRVTAR